MNGRPPAFACLLAVAAALALSACGSSKQNANELTLYNGQHEQTTAKLVAAFEKQSTIKVKVRSGNEAELANQILQEGQSSPADVYYSENTPPLGIGSQGSDWPLQTRMPAAATCPASLLIALSPHRSSTNPIHLP